MWFVIKDGQEHGPFSDEEVKSLLSQGQFAGNDHIMHTAFARSVPMQDSLFADFILPELIHQPSSTGYEPAPSANLESERNEEEAPVTAATQIVDELEMPDEVEALVQEAEPAAVEVAKKLEEAPPAADGEDDVEMPDFNMAAAPDEEIEPILITPDELLFQPPLDRSDESEEWMQYFRIVKRSNDRLRDSTYAIRAFMIILGISLVSFLGFFAPLYPIDRGLSYLSILGFIPLYIFGFNMTKIYKPIGWEKSYYVTIGCLVAVFLGLAVPLLLLQFRASLKSQEVGGDYFFFATFTMFFWLLHFIFSAGGGYYNSGSMIAGMIYYIALVLCLYKTRRAALEYSSLKIPILLADKRNNTR